MQRQIYKLPTRAIQLPKRLFKLVRDYGTPLDDVYFYNKNSNLVELFYKKPGSIDIIPNAEIFETRDQAENRRNELEAIDKYSKIKKEKEEADEKIKQLENEKGELKDKVSDLESSVEYKNSTIRLRESKIEELEKQIDELKSLPPVNVETIHNEFDDLQDENLTKTQKRGRSNWEK